MYLSRMGKNYSLYKIVDIYCCASIFYPARINVDMERKPQIWVRYCYFYKELHDI